MAKVIFGAKPKTFGSMEVKFKAPDGSELPINVVFKYRTATEYGEFLNVANKDAQVPLAADGSVDYKAVFGKTAERTALLLAGSIESWDVEGHEPNRENLERLADELPAAVHALVAAYRAACVEGRLGN